MLEVPYNFRLCHNNNRKVSKGGDVKCIRNRFFFYCLWPRGEWRRGWRQTHPQPPCLLRGCWFTITTGAQEEDHQQDPSNPRCDLYSTNLLIYSVPSFGHLLLSPIKDPQEESERSRAHKEVLSQCNRNVQEVRLLLLFRKITSLIQLIFWLFS